MRMKLAKDVDVQSSHCLKKEFHFFEGKLGRVNEFITLTASIYHSLLKSQIILATMDCKHEDNNYIERFWRIFNNAYKEANLTTEKFNPTSWCSDMAGANFDGLKNINGEDVVNKIKGCEFQYKESISKKVKQLGEKGDQIKTYALDLLTASTQGSYSAHKSKMKHFIKKN